MIVVRGFVWDDWNKEHLYKHGVTIKEVEEVCHGEYKVIKSYRKRIQMLGKTRNGKTLTIILSPEQEQKIQQKISIFTQALVERDQSTDYYLIPDSRLILMNAFRNGIDRVAGLFARYWLQSTSRGLFQNLPIMNSFPQKCLYQN